MSERPLLPAKRLVVRCVAEVRAARGAAAHCEEPGARAVWIAYANGVEAALEMLGLHPGLKMEDDDG